MSAIIPSNDWVFTYCQSTGEFGLGSIDHDDRGDYIVSANLFRGYSGHGVYVNDAASEHLPGRGPIPRGLWYVGTPIRHERLGPVAIRLVPDHGWDVPGGRSGFYIHGDNREANQTASSGCIVLDKGARDFIGRFSGRQLWVYTSLVVKPEGTA